MNSLAEWELRIIAELEELGNENVPAIMNTVGMGTGAASEIDAMKAALVSLIEGGFAEIQMTSMPDGTHLLSRHDALAEISRLSEHLAYVTGSKHWTDIRMSGPPYFQTPIPEIVRTGSGLTKGIAVLEERGYKWWM